MCSPAFSWSVNKNGKFFYKNNILSHSALSEYYNLPDDNVIKAEYNWWENYNPEKIIWHSKHFNPSLSVLKNSINLIQKYFHNKDKTFKWVKDNFCDRHVPRKFIEHFSFEDVVTFFHRYKNDLNSSTLARIVEYTLKEEIVSAAFYTGFHKFNVEELYYITRFSSNERVKISALEAGINMFSPGQLAKICLAAKNKHIISKTFHAGLDKFTINDLADIAKYILQDDLDMLAFNKGVDTFTKTHLSDIALKAKSFNVRKKAEKVLLIIDPRMEY